jgi:GNAT superfamily N-acetyltransferase
MAISIDRVDVRDDAVIDEFRRVQIASDDDPNATPLTRAELVAIMRREHPYWDFEWYVARDDTGRAIGYSQLSVALADNTSLGEAQIGVLPEFRRRGYGTSILADTFERLRQLGRTSVLASTKWPVGADPSPGVHLLEKAGLTRRAMEAHRVLDLPIPTAEHHRLAAKIAPHHADYQLVGWSGSTPDEWAEQYAVLLGLIIAEAPQDEIEIEPEKFDVARLRDQEQAWSEQQREPYVVVAIASDGRLAGHTQLLIPESDPVNAYQWDTLVLKEHRGHRLGLALKLANHLAVADALGNRKRLHTWNAASNGPMIAVNDSLGYRPVTQIALYQGSL